MNIPQAVMMQRPTILEQSKDIERQLDNKNHKFQKSNFRNRIYGLSSLSTNQYEFWYLYKRDSLSVEYNVYRIFEIQGKIKKTALERALFHIVKRHKLLASKFFEKNDGAVKQRYQEPKDKVLDYIRVKSKREADEKIKKIISAPFNLLREYPFRFVLISNGLSSYLVINIHHIVVDGWSSSIFLKELRNFYSEFSEKKDLKEKKITSSYFDYVAWQKEWLKSDEALKALKYWEKELSDISPTEVYPDFIKKQSMLSVGRTRLMESKDMHTISSICKLNNVTPYVFFYTVFNIFLARYTQSNEVTIGSPVANRTNHEYHSVIGPFVNTLVFRMPIDVNENLNSHLLCAQKKLVSNINNQSVPFATIYSQLISKKLIQPDQRLFSIFFYMEDASEYELMLPDLNIQHKGYHNGTAKFDISVRVIAENEKYSIDIEYNSSLYKDETIDNFISIFSQYVSRIADNPTTPINRIPLYESSGINSLSILKGTQVSLKRPVLSDIFEGREYEQTVAIQQEKCSISYKSLFERVNSCASYLLNRPELQKKPIGVFMNRSIEAVIAMLAILKTGNIYVPINMQAPKDRIRKIIEQANLALIITNNEDQSALQGVSVDCRTIWSVENVIHQNVQKSILIGDAAYMIFTSGTTGIPKAIIQTHKTLTNLTLWQSKQIMSSQHKVAMFSSFGFDVSIQEVFYSLYTRSTLFVIPESAKKDPSQLWQYICRYGIEILFIPPQALYMLCCIDDWRDAKSAPLRYIITAGEALKIGVNEKAFFLKFKDIKLINQYGPSETHVATSFELSMDRSLWTDSPPIGSPIANTNIFIVDSDGSLLPRNTIGEVYIGGSNVAEGYYGASKQTNEKFIQKSFLNENSDKVYKSGDLAKIDSENNIIYFGRADRQVKISGYRVELSEIELNLLDHQNVKLSSVIQRMVSGKKILIAYIVPYDSKYEVANYKFFLEEKLPEYMLPKNYLHVKKIILNENGKVDVSALPLPVINKVSFTKPQTNLQQKISTIWKKILNLPSNEIDINTNFFDIGGSSLLVVKMLVSIEHVLKIKIKTRSVYENPTIKELSLYIENNHDDKFDMLPLFKAPDNVDTELTDQQSFWWVVDKIVNDGSNHVQFTLSVESDVNEKNIERCLMHIASENVVLRISISEENGTPKQCIHKSARPKIECLDLLQDKIDTKKKKFQKYIEESGRKPFNLNDPPLYRVTFIKYDKNKTIIYFCFHHIIFDEWSMNIFMEQFKNSLKLIYLKKPLLRKPLEIDYNDYAYTQQQWKSKSLLESRKEFWNSIVKSAPRDVHILYDKNIFMKFGASKKISLQCDEKEIISYYTKNIFGECMSNFQRK